MSTMVPRLITAEEFCRMPSPPDGSKQELVKGVVVTMPPPKARHGLAQTRISWLLMNHVMPARLGWVATEAGVVLDRNPDTVRGPGVTFYTVTRQPTVPDDYFEIPPDLAIEVLSPDARRAAVREKIREYVASGVRLVDPDARTVLVYRGSLRGTEYDESDTVDGGDVLPEFTCKVADFFA